MHSLYILRHGIAEPPPVTGRTKDRDRALTAEGRQKVRRVARALVKLDVGIDLIVSSPYVRARQTAELVAEVLRLRSKVQLCEHLAPGAKPKDLIAYLKALDPAPDSVLLVGHEPDLSRLIALLLCGSPTLSLSLKKAGLCKLTLMGLTAGRCGTLEWLLTPKQMSLMS